MNDYIFVYQEWDVLREKYRLPEERLEKTPTPSKVVSVGGRIQEVRIHNRLSIPDLAKRLGIEPRILSAFENGSEIPTQETMRAIEALSEKEEHQ